MPQNRLIVQIKDPTKGVAIFLASFIVIAAVEMCLADLYLGAPAQNVSCTVHDAKYACDCGLQVQTMQLPLLSGNVYELEVKNCKALVIEANSLDNLNGLKKINFENIDNLLLHKYALAYSRYASSTPLIIEFKKVIIDVIDSHAFNGNIEEIHFISGRIRVIHPFAFTTFKERAALIKFEDTWIGNIEAQAFKRVTIGKFEILNCQFETNVPSKAFYEVEVESLTVQKNRFREVHTKAFAFKKVSKLTVTLNNFVKNNAAWIEAQVMESIDLQDNNFGYTNELSFKDISVHRDYIKTDLIELRFFNNTVHFEAEPKPLEFNARFLANIKNLRYENRYNCKNINFEVNPPQPSQKFFQRHADSTFFQTADSANNKSSNQNQSFVVLAQIIESDCRQRSYLLYIILGALSLVVLIVIIAILVYYKWVQRQRRRKMDIVLPEPRTYKETQIVYQIENAGLLKTDL